MGLLLSASTFGVLLFGAVRNWSAGSLMVLVFLGAFLFFLRPFLDRDLSELCIPPGGLLFLLMPAYTALLLLQAPIPHEARIELLKVGSYAAAYWAWTELSMRYRRWRFLLGIPLFLGTLVALYALVQHAQGTNMVLNMERPEQYGMRASGTFMAPTHFGAYLGTLLCLAACLIPMKSAGAVLRLLGVYSLVVFLPALFLSQSRSGWVGATVGLSVVVCLLSWRQGGRRLLVALAGVPLFFGAIFGALWSLSETFQERVREGLLVRGTAAHRINMWQDTWVMIQDRFWFGHGPGSYRWVHPPYKTWLEDRWLRYAHNEYLHLWAEYGVVGLVLMTLVFGFIFFSLLRVFRRLERDRDAYLVAGFTGALCAALAHAVFDFNLHVFALCHLLVLFGGVTMGGLFASGVLKARAVPFSVWATTGGAALLLVLGGALFSLQAAASGAWTRLGEEKMSDIDPRSLILFENARKDFNRAARIDPAFWLPHLELGDLARRQAFWIRDPEYRAEKAQEALAHYRRAYELNPYDMNVVYGLGRSLFMLGEEEKSLEYLRRAAAFWPTNLFYAKQLGLQLREMGRLEEALVAFQQARDIDPSDPVVQTNIRLLERDLRSDSGNAPKRLP